MSGSESFQTPGSKFKRRSLIPFHSTPLTKIDNEHERSNRRSVIAIQKRLSIIPAESPPTTLDRTKMESHLLLCQKLHQENKINTTNAWNLHIMDLLLKLTCKEESDTLKVAANNLELGSKVYGLRVDDVHAKSLKLAGNVAASNKNEQCSGDDDDDGNVDPENVQSAKKKSRRKKLKLKKKCTIDQTGHKLFGRLPQLDPPLFSTKDDITVAAVDNLFTTKLHTNPSTHRFELIGKSKYWSTDKDAVLNSQQTLEVPWVSLPHFQLCEPLKKFVLDQWSPEEDTFKTKLDNSLIVDDIGRPIAELDGSICDIFAENNMEPIDADSDTISDKEEIFHNKLQGDIVKLEDAVPEESRIEGQYGYNSFLTTATGQRIERVWAGPNHWKVKFIKRTALKFSGVAEENPLGCAPKRTMKKRVPEKINFEIQHDDIELDSKQVIKREPGTSTFNKITFPIPYSVISKFEETTRGLTLKPNVVVGFDTKTTKSFDHDDEFQPYNYNNPNDSQYCNADLNDSGSIGNTDHIPTEDAITDDINIPDIVTLCPIQYSHFAKNIDVKKLKIGVWNLLKPNMLEDSYSYSNVLRELPKTLSEKMKKDLSPHLAVFAILQLANENNLQLIQNDKYTDFIVKKAQ